MDREVLAMLLYITDPGHYDPEGSGSLDAATIRADAFISALDATGFVIMEKDQLAIETAHGIVSSIEGMIKDATSPPVYGERRDHAQDLMNSLIELLTKP